MNGDPDNIANRGCRALAGGFLLGMIGLVWMIVSIFN